MSRFWSLLFCLVPILGLGFYALSVFDIAPMKSTWLPENISVDGKVIDSLFNMIHVICAVIFLLTTSILALALWRYRSQPGRKASSIHSNARLEIVWSIIPAAILVFLSLYQYDSWADSRIRRPMVGEGESAQPKPPNALIIAKQFGWEVYYPGPDGQLGSLDDIYVENQLILPEGEDIVLQLESRDVIHSFFVPELRVKQDIVPGMTHYCWFRPVGSDPEKKYEIACTELCGWGHYKMKGWLQILPAAEYETTMDRLAAERYQTGNDSFDQQSVGKNDE